LQSAKRLKFVVCGFHVIYGDIKMEMPFVQVHNNTVTEIYEYMKFIYLNCGIKKPAPSWLDSSIG